MLVRVWVRAWMKIYFMFAVLRTRNYYLGFDMCMMSTWDQDTSINPSYPMSKIPQNTSTNTLLISRKFTASSLSQARVNMRCFQFQADAMGTSSRWSKPTHARGRLPWRRTRLDHGFQSVFVTCASRCHDGMQSMIAKNMFSFCCFKNLVPALK